MATLARLRAQLLWCRRRTRFGKESSCPPRRTVRRSARRGKPPERALPPLPRGLSPAPQTETGAERLLADSPALSLIIGPHPMSLRRPAFVAGGARAKRSFRGAHGRVPAGACSRRPTAGDRQGSFPHVETKPDSTSSSARTSFRARPPRERALAPWRGTPVQGRVTWGGRQTITLSRYWLAVSTRLLPIIAELAPDLHNRVLSKTREDESSSYVLLSCQSRIHSASRPRHGPDQLAECGSPGERRPVSWVAAGAARARFRRRYKVTK